jgi:hypothetical protein
VAAVLEGVDLTAWKTAGDSALGASCLARKDVSTMLMVGAGSMARPLIDGAPLGAAVDRAGDDLEPQARARRTGGLARTRTASPPRWCAISTRPLAAPG